MTVKMCYVCKKEFPLEEMCKNRKCKLCMKEYKKTYYASHKKQYADCKKEHRVKHKESIQEKDKVYRSRYKERDGLKAKLWAENNRDRRNESQQRRRARIVGSMVVKVTPSMLKDRLWVFDNRCAYCDGPFQHWDHVKPLILGGPHILANLRPACGKCNDSKGHKSAKEWLDYVKKRNSKGVVKRQAESVRFLHSQLEFDFDDILSM